MLNYFQDKRSHHLEPFANFISVTVSFPPSANWKEILAREIELDDDSLKKTIPLLFKKLQAKTESDNKKKHTQRIFFHFARVFVTNYKSHAFQ